MKHVKEKAAELLFLLSALASIFAVAIICIFLFANGIPAIFEIGRWNSLPELPAAGKQSLWNSPMILGSIYVTAGAIVVGVPLEFSPRFSCPGSAQRDL